MTQFKRIGQYAIPAVLILVAFVFLLLLLPLFLLILPFLRRREELTDKAYGEFLATVEGQTFFAYTNKKKTQKFIEESIVSSIPAANVIFLEGKTVHAQFSRVMAQRLLLRPLVEGGFPLVIHISNGQVYNTSVSNALNKAIMHNDPGIVFESINNKLPT